MLLARRPLWSVVMRKRRNLTDNCLNQREKKKRGKPPLFLSLPPTSPALIPSAWSLCICGKHLGSFIPTQAGWRTPVPSRVAGPERASVWVLVVVEERSSSLPASLSGPSQSSHPPLPLFHQAPGPSQMPLSMVNVALHLNWKILNRFIQKLQRRQPALRFRSFLADGKESAEEAKPVLQINVCVCGWGRC